MSVRLLSSTVLKELLALVRRSIASLEVSLIILYLVQDNIAVFMLNSTGAQKRTQTSLT